MQSEPLNSKSKLLPWLFLLVVTLLPLLVWASNLGWRLKSVTTLTLFPFLGLWAWSIMWTHYAYGSLRIVYPELQKNKIYSKITGYLVLGLILLHPGIVALSQWKFQHKLPPGSYYGYVDSSMKLFIVFGAIALLTLLSFDVFERLKHKAIVQRNWHWVSFSQMLAMLLIFVHSLELGQTFSSSWFEFYWVALGALLIPCFGLIGRLDWQSVKKLKR